MPANEECGVSRVAFKYFPYHPHLWILAMERVRQVTNKAARHVLNGVLTNAIDAHDTNPPERILYFVTGDFGLFLIHVRQIIAKPSVKRIAEFVLIRVRRKQCTVSESIELVMCDSAVKPIVERRIFHPGVLRAYMIGHLVLNYFDPQAVRLFNQ